MSIFCVAKVVGLVEFLWGEDGQFVWGKVVAWVEFVCAQGGQVAGGWPCAELGKSVWASKCVKEPVSAQQFRNPQRRSAFPAKRA